MIKICIECGKVFEARKKSQQYCKGPHITRCVICGNEFEYTCLPNVKPKTCSMQCKQISRKQVILAKYGVTNVSQLPEVRAKKRISNASPEAQARSKATCLERYGVEYAAQADEIRAKISERLQSDDVREKVKHTMQEHYGVDHVFQLPEYRERYGCNVVSQLESTKQAVRETLQHKYGVDCTFRIPEIIEKAKVTRAATNLAKHGSTCIFSSDTFKRIMTDKYGAANPSKSAELLSKASRNKQKKSSLELRLHNILDQYNIEHVDEYPIVKNDLAHSFDMYLPQYKILVDCDGEYWHSYLSDPDGERVRDDGDPVRLSLIPDDHIFHLIIESDFERGIRDLLHIISEIDSGTFNYDTELFKWCRSVGFPKYHYSDERLHSEWDRLTTYEITDYNENRWFGVSLINQFHPSVFDCHVDGKASPREAWYDDASLKKVILNRLIYRNDVDPTKILQGFTISKIAPRASLFNPTLAKYIVSKYLNQFDTVCDPFSGFSGRLLGVTSAGKYYVGRDLNDIVVKESNALIQYLQLSADVSCSDVMSDVHYKYPCLLTCPPYSDKEVYSKETVFHTCDDWIDIVLAHYDCSRYVFVVDATEKYKDNIIEELKSKSHFRRSSEYVILIDK